MLRCTQCNLTLTRVEILHRLRVHQLKSCFSQQLNHALKRNQELHLRFLQRFQHHLHLHSEGIRPCSRIIILLVDFCKGRATLPEDVFALACQQPVHCRTINRGPKEHVLAVFLDVFQEDLEHLFRLARIIHCHLACHRIKLFKVLKVAQIRRIGRLNSHEDVHVLAVLFLQRFREITLNEENLGQELESPLFLVEVARTCALTRHRQVGL